MSSKRPPSPTAKVPGTSTEIASSTPAAPPEWPSLFDGSSASVPFSPFATVAPRSSTGILGQPDSLFRPSSSFPSFAAISPRASTVPPGQHGLTLTPSPFSPIPSLSSARARISSSATSTMRFPALALGLRGQYNSSLLNREEWARLGPTLSALRFVHEAPPGSLRSDFVFEFVYQSQPMQTFDALHQIKVLKINVLLLSPDRFTASNRRETGSATQNFAVVNKSSTGVIVYLMDVQSSEGQRVEDVQSLSDLHNFLSLGVSEPPPVLVVPEVSYLIGCIEGYMKSVSRANPRPVQTDEPRPLMLPAIPTPVKSERENPFLHPQK